MATATILHHRRYRDDRRKNKNKKDIEKKNEEDANEKARNKEETDQSNGRNTIDNQVSENQPIITTYMH